MKNKIIFAILGLASLLITFWVMKTDAVKSSNNNSNLVLKISSEKESYILGEIINLGFELKDETGEAMTLRSIPTVENGYMHVWIASANRDFKEYRGSRWGLDEGSIPPQRGNSFKSRAAILWNNKPPAEWKGEAFARDLLETDYAVLESGVYLVKVTASVWTGEVRSEDAQTIIESAPIQIVINEPIGNDLKIWNKIKTRTDIAYFIQVGDFRTSDPKEREKLLKEIEEITTKYPGSLLAGQMKQSLEQFQKMEEKIKESLQKKSTKSKE